MKKSPNAFSLIELSIVILIIGILVAGVTQSSRLIRQFKLSSARSVTEASPVASISGLVLWLEPTKENSFLAAETEDEGQITTWNDTNPQAVSKNNFTKTASAVFTYENDATNGLPGIECSGANGTDQLAGSLILTPSNYFTLFVVSKQSASTNNTIERRIFNVGDASTNGFSYVKDITTGTRNLTYQAVVDRTSSIAFTVNNEISSMTYGLASGGGNITNLYVNGAASTISGSTSTMIAPTTSITIGTGWMGTISEVIMFERALKNSERREVEEYLSKKYEITVVSN
jgi:prepilin-type N-terminal cleavage/methylation domain-containing protein